MRGPNSKKITPHPGPLLVGRGEGEKSVFIGVHPWFKKEPPRFYPKRLEPCGWPRWPAVAYGLVANPVGAAGFVVVVVGAGVGGFGLAWLAEVSTMVRALL